MNSPIESYISYALAAAHRKVHQSLAAKLKAHGMQVESWRVLETLDSAEPLVMGKLADIVLMNPPTLTKLVDRMVMDGLVHRQIGRQDQRQVHLALTDLGRKRMQQIRGHVDDAESAIRDLLGPEDADTLSAILNSLR